MRKKNIAKKKVADVCEHPLKLNRIKSFFLLFVLFHAPLRKTGRPQSNFLAKKAQVQAFWLEALALFTKFSDVKFKGFFPAGKNWKMTGGNTKRNMAGHNWFLHMSINQKEGRQIYELVENRTFSILHSFHWNFCEISIFASYAPAVWDPRWEDY